MRAFDIRATWVLYTLTGGVIFGVVLAAIWR